MASIRRTLSPYHNNQDRSHHQNGGGGNTYKLNSTTTTTRFPSPLSTFNRFIDKPRKPPTTWRNLLFTCLLFFLLGFLLGLAPPFNHHHHQDYVIRNPDFSSFEVKRPPILDVKENIIIDKLELSLENKQNVKYRFDYDHRNKLLILITPTYNRPLQAFYLNRLAQLLRLVPPPLLWIVVEINLASTETADILRGMGIMYRHLVCAKNLTNLKDRGVHQRNTALEHIKHHKLDGIVYFADDDNVYSLQLFDTLRDIRYTLFSLVTKSFFFFRFLC